MDKNLLPDFLIIGAGKCGTTSVDNYLKQHPSIFVTAFKEPNFFGFEMVKPEDFDDPNELKYYQDHSITDLKSYQDLYKEAEPGQIKGETSNTYLYHETAPERIKHYVPDVKMIAIFRQPAERLYSRYLHLARVDQLPTPTFEGVLDKSTIWWERNDLVKEGFYYKNLSKFYDHFDKDQIKVVLFEDLKKDPQGIIQSIAEFVGADGSFEFDLSVEYNKSGFIKNKFYDKMIGQNSIIKKGIKSMVPTSAFEKLKSNPWLRKKFTDITDKNLVRPKLEPELKQKVTDIYRADIQQLAKLINRDLSHWL
ncbi:sulfotransferase family protein [Fulvivirga ligni]|uniref:sulfotransferase family protein n=1 Tax=Fulvivirga ligni TaxID=2904246 RepID=UPI001F439C9B|nr:sulfotransferase domain-containing protein [Fulvivirga ligni]UII21149.1 sulfotransferase [Fulvivirga ligni]